VYARGNQPLHCVLKFSPNCQPLFLSPVEQKIYPHTHDVLCYKEINTRKQILNKGKLRSNKEETNKGNHKNLKRGFERMNIGMVEIRVNE